VIRWGQPVYLWLLLAVPVLAALSLVVGALKRRRLARAADAHLVPALTETYSPGLARLKNLLLVGALALLLVAAARPKWGERLQLYRGRGIDVVIALDASKSMLAEDVKPNRLQRAKTELAALIDGLSGNNVGIVAFAGEAYVMCPLTTDAGAARMFLDIIGPEMMPVPGTDFGKAIDRSLELFNPKEPTHKALVLVTDGEDLGRNTAQAVDRAATTGVQIFPVAFVTTEGAPIPEYDERGNLQSYKKDKDGQVVMSRMDERELVVMAQASGGRFMRVEGFSGERMLAELSRIRQKDIGGGRYTDFVERYQWFLAAALVLMLAGLGLSNRRGRWLEPGSLRLPRFLRSKENNEPQSH
jgi:Ca-activated chloride channel family protein